MLILYPSRTFSAVGLMWEGSNGMFCSDTVARELVSCGLARYESNNTNPQETI